MQIKLPNGIVLDDSEMWAADLAAYAKRKGVEGVRAFVATHLDGSKRYLIVDGEAPCCENSSFEVCAAFIDVMALNKNIRD